MPQLSVMNPLWLVQKALPTKLELQAEMLPWVFELQNSVKGVEL